MALDSRGKIRHRMENGVVSEFRNKWYYVPISGSAEDAVLAKAVYTFAVEDDSEIIASGIDVEDMVEFLDETEAVLWGRLQDLVAESYETAPLEYDPTSVATRAREESVPVSVARESKEVLAAYLVALGHSRTGVARAVDVSESTVSQYVSNVKGGGR